MKGDFDISAARRAPRTRFNTKVSPHRVFEGCTFKLEYIKAMRSLSDGAKVNDVLLSIIGGGLHKYMDSKNELPDTTMTAMAPISVRAESEKNAMGNQVAAMIAPLGTHIEDPVERIQYVHGETTKSKAMTNALGARQMTEVSKASPSLFFALGAQLYTRLGLANRVKPVINTIVTNVPGPPIPIYSTGAKLVSMHGMLCLLDGVGLGHVVQSYVDQTTIGFTACRKLMPDPEFYAQCLNESFGEMAKAAGIKLTPPKPKRAPAKKKTTTRPKTAAKTTARAKSTTRKTAASGTKKPATTRRKTTASTTKTNRKAAPRKKA